MEVLKRIGNNVADLIDLKSIITIIVVAVFCYLSVVGTIQPEVFMTICTMIISFYFGTKVAKADNTASTTEPVQDDTEEDEIAG